MLIRSSSVFIHHLVPLCSQLILELCRFDADFELIQPHLDCLQTLIQDWVKEVSWKWRCFSVIIILLCDHTPKICLCCLQVRLEDVEAANCEFVDLVRNLQKNPEERELFFQVSLNPLASSSYWCQTTIFAFLTFGLKLLQTKDCILHLLQKVFPDKFGPGYDEALHMLMSIFLSRLEDFLSYQTFHQVMSFKNK